MTHDEIIAWLLEGDVAIRYQTRRDLLGDDDPALQARIEHEGWGALILSRRNPDGSWGNGFYDPKWTSSHYTLVDLASLGLPSACEAPRESVALIVRDLKGDDGGINPARTVAQSDVCINGLFLSYACRFGAAGRDLESVLDFLLAERMEDGGFNCRRNRSGARHSSLHSTICVLEGFAEYRRRGYDYRLAEVAHAEATAREFILIHRLFRSDRTGEVIHPSFLTLSVPPRWKYNILRALDYFRVCGVAWDERMADAVEALLAKRRPDGRWPAQAAHPGEVHVRMEKPRQPSRWNTLMALRVLGAYRH